MLLKDSVNKPHHYSEGERTGRHGGKIDIFVPLRTCCFATKLLLMQACPVPMKGLGGAGRRVRAVPLPRLPNTTEQTEVFLTVYEQRERKEYLSRTLKGQ